MKLRFCIDAKGCARIHDVMDAVCEEPPVGRRLSYLYLDTDDGALAAHGVALRFRRSVALGARSPARPWRRQEIRSKAGTSGSIKKLGIKRLKQRLDAAFDLHIERWTWIAADGWAKISLDHGEISTGSAKDMFYEMRIACRKKHKNAAMDYAVALGATRLLTTRAWERGYALLKR